MMLSVLTSAFYRATRLIGPAARRCFRMAGVIMMLCVLTFHVPAEAQKNKTKKNAKAATTPDVSQHEEKVKDIVSFLQYVLNTLGSHETGARDKEVLITESYAKIFRDAKVQVEDDLDPARNVITNKDVIAYLKDVDFFFQDVNFELTVEKIEGTTLPDGLLFYKVFLTRRLTGVTSDGKPVNNTIPRYVEVNFNPETQDLRIVSIYTNEFNEKEALTRWWSRFSFEWQAIFKRTLTIEKDSLTLQDIKDVTAITELDLSDNTLIQTIEPLGALAGLRVLNLSRTSVADLVPIRNLTELQELDISHTAVADLSPLKYAGKMTRFVATASAVTDIAVLENMSVLKDLVMRGANVMDFKPLASLISMETLDLSATSVSDLSFITGLSRISDLNLSRTNIQDLQPLRTTTSLKTLNIDSTSVTDIAPLGSADSLQVLYANHTSIADLQPLADLDMLERIYCDQTRISREQANGFMAAHPGVLVVYDSKDLISWWGSLDKAWKTTLSRTAGTGANPSKEELVIVTNVDSINFSGNNAIDDLEPLRKLLKVRVLIAEGSGITSLAPLEHHRNITYLDISNTLVTDLSPLTKFPRLKVLKADNSKIESIEPLYDLSTLETIYADQTYVHDIVARELLEKNTKCLIVYKTNHLNRWWRNITGRWVKLFQSQMTDTTTTRENLHRLVELEILKCTNHPVRDLSALSEFVRLKELRMSGTAVNEIPALEALTRLKTLQVSDSPLRNIEGLSSFADLRELDISNTAIEELDAIGNLQELRILNSAGTQIRKLNPLEALVELQHLDCSNTAVRSLDPIMNLSLTTLKCYNTGLSGKKVEKFAERNPGCNIIFYR